MSRAYQMDVEVKEVTDEQATRIDEQLNFESEGVDEGTIFGGTYNNGFETNLCGGESEDEYAARLSKDIWKALGEFKPIIIRQTCLEYLPGETYELDEEAYDEAMKD